MAPGDADRPDDHALARASVALAFDRASSRYDAAAPRIDIETLIISGQHDRITPPGAATWLAAAMPGARVIELPRAGHAPFLSHAPDFTRELRAFLEAA